MSRNAQSSAHLPRLNFLLLCLFMLAAPRLAARQPGIVVDTNVPPARVVIVEDPLATDDLQPVPEKIQLMVDRAITNLTGKPTVRAAWNSLVATNDIVGLKVFSSPGPNSGTRPAVVAAVVQGLIASGLPPRNIIIWDKSISNLRDAGFLDFERHFGVRVQGAIQAGYDTNKFYETALLGTLIWSDSEFGQTGPGVGRKSYVSKILTKDITKIINITPMLHHNLVGVSGNLFSLALGSVDNTGRFEKDSDTLARAIPEIYALPVVGDRVVLNIVDALMCQYEGQQRGLLHYSTVLNQLRFSRDPLALDVLSLADINRERQLAGSSLCTNMDLFNNAALLEIGAANTNRIKVEQFSQSQPAFLPGNSPPSPPSASR